MSGNTNANSQSSPRKRHRKLKANKQSNGSSPKAPAVLTPNANRRTAGANWNAVVNNNKIGPENRANGSTATEINHNGPNQKQPRPAHPGDFVAMDCEMVGIGFQGRDDMLARVSIVNKSGNVLLDKYVKPVEIVTDYRTPVSGIRPNDLVNAEELTDVQREVQKILKGRILVGHNIQKDLQVLHITHPLCNTRDTSSYKPLARLVSNGRTPSLKRLSLKILGIEIQTGEHSSVEDARAAMNVYKHVAHSWEDDIRKKNYRRR